MAAKQHPSQGVETQNATAPAKAQDNTSVAKAGSTNIPPELQAELDRLRAENDALKGSQGVGRAVSLKVSDKGAVSAYGMGRFPVTLYREQWEKLLAEKEHILEFIVLHDSELKKKEPKA